MSRGFTHPKGFTLVESMVVISAIALLVGLLLPALGSARAAARSAVCLSNVRTMAHATLAYAVDHKTSLVKVRTDVPGGRRWWFGLEVGPVGGQNRPVDLQRSPLSSYTADFASGVSCPDFPYQDPGFNPKFATPSAHFGFNGGLCEPFPLSVPRRLPEVLDPAGTFVFADAVHQDFAGDRFNEPHEVAFRGVGAVSGAGHFRHPRERANASYVDGHAGAMDAGVDEPVWARFGSGPVVNLDRAQGVGTAYGFATWTAALVPGTVRR